MDYVLTSVGQSDLSKKKKYADSAPNTESLVFMESRPPMRVITLLLGYFSHKPLRSCERNRPSARRKWYVIIALSSEWSPPLSNSHVLVSLDSESNPVPCFDLSQLGGVKAPQLYAWVCFYQTGTNKHPSFQCATTGSSSFLFFLHSVEVPMCIYLLMSDQRLVGSLKKFQAG